MGVATAIGLAPSRQNEIHQLNRIEKENMWRQKNRIDVSGFINSDTFTGDN